MIPFNKPHITGKEFEYIQQAISSRNLSGDGVFTKKCHSFFENKYGFKKALLTTSCTDALEMAAILCNIKPGDEVIAPSYTFVSTVNAFVLRGATIKFIDSEQNTPNIDTGLIEQQITPNTKAIICVHYAGISCHMDDLCEIAKKHNLILIEDVAQAIDGYYKEKPLGSFGTFSVFSFHETKNISCGEGGLLVINDEAFINRAEIIRDKGTNRKSFINGEVDKYGWVDIGSSFLPSELNAAYLFSQLENLDNIQSKRKELWNYYYSKLKPLENNKFIHLPFVPNYSSNAAHSFYIVCNSLNERTQLISHLKTNGITAFFHHISLHNSKYYKEKHDGRNLPMSDYFTNNLVRLPLYFDLKLEDIDFICENIKAFYN